MNRATVLVLLGGLVLTTIFIVAPRATSPEPFVPKSDAEVLEVVPRDTPRQASAPLTAEQAAARVRQLLDEAQRTGEDPRLLGRAQATLAPWWSDPSPPPPLRLLRASLKQRLHDFEGALADLGEPLDAPGWLTRAQVLTTLARYSEAADACTRAGSAPCRARLQGLQGHAKEALASTAPLPLSLRGELEHWSGDDARAVATLEQALTLDPTDTASRLLLGQIQLDLGQPAPALKFFEERTLSQGELLLQVLLLAAAGAPEYQARREELGQRISADRQRGETLHQREEAQYALALEGDSAKALALATRNWAVQKEPPDARVLLAAALTANEPKAAAPVLQWLKDTGCTEPSLVALAKEFGAP